MDTRKNICLLLITFLVHSNSADAPRQGPSQAWPLKDLPNWEYILREFVFKTIFSPVQSDNTLYKKLLDAPFYGGPLPTPSSEDNALLSRGNVYHLPDGRWILCQDGCKDCEPCSGQKDSLVKWTLKRMKRFISPNTYRYDLQLTIVPQMTPISNFQSGSYIYTPRNLLTSAELADPDEKERNKRSRTGRTWRRLQRNETRSSSVQNTMFINNQTFQLPNFDHNITELQPMHRLIMGVDQSGKKHLIHVLTINPTALKDAPSFNNLSYQVINGAARLGKSFSPQGTSYRKYVKTILDSIHSHRSVIESFLASDSKIKNSSPATAFYPVYSDFTSNDSLANFNSQPKFGKQSGYWFKDLKRVPRKLNLIKQNSTSD